MINKIKYCVYLVVFIGFSSAIAGSYDDFFSAIKHDNPDVIRTLLGRGFDPNTVSPGGEFGLILAIKEPSFKVVDALLDSPTTRVEVRTVKDESPLMLAALKGYLAVCQKLIARDADVNKPGWTPLHYAATGGHLDVIQILLDNHAYIDAASPNGSTPLMMAAMYGSTEAVQMLLDAGADPIVKNGLGLTAIDFATRVQNDAAIELIAKAIRTMRAPGSW